MTGGFTEHAARAWAGLCALLLLCIFAVPASAGQIAPQCVAYSDLSEEIADVVADPNRWNCDQPEADLWPERGLLRFQVDPTADTPTHLMTRRADIKAIHIGLVSASGELSLHSYTLNDQQPATIEGFVSLPIQSDGKNPASIVVAFDAPTTPVLFTRSRLTQGDPLDFADTRRGQLLTALICGMLMMPILFNFVFYRILRHKFLLWHSFHAIVMVGAVSFNSGIIQWVFPVPMRIISAGSTLSFGFMVASATMFALALIEKDKLHPLLRKAMPYVALAAASLSIIHAAFPYFLRPLQLDLYLLGYLPVLVLLVSMVANALLRGSRAMVYQIAAWFPLLLMGIIRQVSYLTPIIAETDAMALFYFGCAFEVFATAMGVADRFMTIKKERDSALTEAQLFEEVSERDTLTGLLNRRVIVDRFGELRSDGFTTLAVLDLDHFKTINDTFGHAKGDEVLAAVGDALVADEDTVTIRLGGEEFLLMLRGADAPARAEARRRAITTRVASLVEGLDRPVTASMGLVEMPSCSAPEGKFAVFYQQADRLLYEAKAEGRNRTVSERVHMFKPRKRERRRPRAA